MTAAAAAGVHRAVAAVQRVAVAAVARHTGYCIGFTRISCIAAGIAIAITIAVAVAAVAVACRLMLLVQVTIGDAAKGVQGMFAHHLIEGTR